MLYDRTLTPPAAARRTVLLVGLALGSASSCQSSGPPAPGPGADAAASAPASASAHAGVDASAAAVPEAAVRATIDAWLAAQNGGDFAAYQALYAERFEGVRRSGAATAKLDRARWMKDRAPMFRKRMTVTAKNLMIAGSRDEAHVRFDQSWASDTYQDEGPKVMVLSRVAGALRITREEMLRSQVVPHEKLSPEGFAFVLDVAGPRLVLSDVPEEAWATGAPALVSLTTVATTRRDAAVAKLPPGLAAWAGRAVQLFGPGGLACEGTVAGLAVVGRGEPSIATHNLWSGRPELVDGPLPSRAEIAKGAWELSGGEGVHPPGRVLVAEVRADKGDCKEALWGRAADAKVPVPALAAAVPADPKTRALVLAELRKTKAYADVQKDYEAQKEPKDPPRWEDYDAHRGSGVKVFTHPLGTLVVLSLTAGTGCGQFGATMSAVYALKDGVLTPLKEPAHEDVRALSAGDVDGDGILDLLMPEELLRVKAGKYERWWRLHIPSFACGC